MKTKIKFTRERATFKKAHESDSGFDLTACNYRYKGKGLWHIMLGVEVEPPEGFYFEIVPRSSFSKTPFFVPNNIGIIDQGFRGEWRLPVRSVDFPRHDKEDDIEKYLLNKRIAQAILRPYLTTEIVIVDSLSDTERGECGFGSSGE